MAIEIGIAAEYIPINSKPAYREPTEPVAYIRELPMILEGCQLSLLSLSSWHRIGIDLITLQAIIVRHLVFAIFDEMTPLVFC